MEKYFRKRLIILPITWLAIAIVHACLLHLSAERPEAWLATHLSQYQYADAFSASHYSLTTYFIQALKLNFGISIFYQQPVTQLVLMHIPKTLWLTCATIIPLYCISIVLGFGLSQKYKWANTIHKALAAYSALPNCLLYAFIFLIHYHYSPIIDQHQYLIAAGLLVLRRIASLASFASACFISEQNQPYVRLAYVRQINTFRVTTRYLLPNALLPIWTKLPKHFSQILFSGTLSIEVLMAIDGLGRLTFTACKYQDYPLIFGCLMIASILLSLCYLLGDLIQQKINPKLKREYQ